MPAFLHAGARLTREHADQTALASTLGASAYRAPGIWPLRVDDARDSRPSLLQGAQEFACLPWRGRKQWTRGLSVS
jgi:hypothetical protein